MQTWNIPELDERIRKMRILAEELKEMGKGIQAVEKTADRILASISVLELNISDAKPYL
ncbi:MAG: hypothetical protein PHS17_05775 [Desulfobacterales bacterium]|nr:hypothetical protein [Desulfobacterales bacterium]